MVSRVIRKIRFILLRNGLAGTRSFVDDAMQGVAIDKELGQSAKELGPPYNVYVSTVSSRGMAISLELASFMLTWCRRRRPLRLLDLGSGFSSAVFRSYARHFEKTEVFSVDDDMAWLEKSRDFVRSQGLSDSNFFTLEEFRRLGLSDFDCVLLDLSFVEERIKHLELAVKLTGASGLLILDDVHKPDYLFAVLSKLKSAPVKLYTLESLVKDEFGRFALAAVRK